MKLGVVVRPAAAQDFDREAAGNERNYSSGQDVGRRGGLGPCLGRRATLRRAAHGDERYGALSPTARGKNRERQEASV